MFEQDYIMRVIKEMVRVILKLLFHIDTESPTIELLENAEEQHTVEKLLDMVDAGDVNAAENQLYEMLSETEDEEKNDFQKPIDDNRLKTALLFYSYLNDKSDEFLEEHDFSREEIKQGLELLVSRYGLSGMAELFLEEL